MPEQLADIFRISDLHIYLTAPFVLSWSLLDAMATGCVVLAADVPPVREVIEPGQNGLVEPLFDVERLTETALRVLDDPAEFAPLGGAARRTIEDKYSLQACIPSLANFFGTGRDREASDSLVDDCAAKLTAAGWARGSQADKTISLPGSRWNTCS